MAGPALFQINGSQFAIIYRRNPKAHRYILRVKRPACLVATIPRGGSQQEAWAFIQRSQSWIHRQLNKPLPSAPTETWFRGQKIPVAQFDAAQARALAVTELVRRTYELAAQTNSQISR